MSTAYFDVQAALDARLDAMAGTHEIAWQNVEYSPTKDQLFLRPTLLPGSSEAATISTAGTDEYIGVYQVDVFAPAGDGKAFALQMADTIADQFKPVTELTYNGVTVRCMAVNITQAAREEGWHQMSVDVRYMAHPSKR